MRGGTLHHQEASELVIADGRWRGKGPPQVRRSGQGRTAGVAVPSPGWMGELARVRRRFPRHLRRAPDELLEKLVSPTDAVTDPAVAGAGADNAGLRVDWIETRAGVRRAIQWLRLRDQWACEDDNVPSPRTSGRRPARPTLNGRR